MTHEPWEPGGGEPQDASAPLKAPSVRPRSFPGPDPQGVVEGAAAQAVLDRMGLSPDLLTGACLAGLREAITQYSSYEPTTAFGYQQWAKTVGALRAGLADLGWKVTDLLNAPRSVSGDGRLSIAAIKGDDATGQAWRTPANARARGRALVDDIAANGPFITGGGSGSNRAVAHGRYYQPVLGTVLSLDVSASPSDGAGDVAGAPQTWLLLYFWDRSEDAVRCELSLPVACEDGVVTQWHTRVILPSGNLSEAEAVGGPADGDSAATLPSDDVDFVIQAV